MNGMNPSLDRPLLDREGFLREADALRRRIMMIGLRMFALFAGAMIAHSMLYDTGILSEKYRFFTGSVATIGIMLAAFSGIRASKMLIRDQRFACPHCGRPLVTNGGTPLVGMTRQCPACGMVVFA